MPEESNDPAETPGLRVRRTGRRRVTTDAVAGSDPAPQLSDGSAVEKADEDTDASWGDPSPRGSDKNDDRLKLEKPPHW